MQQYIIIRVISQNYFAKYKVCGVSVNNIAEY